MKKFTSRFANEEVELEPSTIHDKLVFVANDGAREYILVTNNDSTLNALDATEVNGVQYAKGAFLGFVFNYEVLLDYSFPNTEIIFVSAEESKDIKIIQKPEFSEDSIDTDIFWGSDL